MTSTTTKVGHNLTALRGFCPVSYFTEGKTVKGTPEIRSEYKGATYNFFSEENKAKFDADPEKYAPQYNGWCATAMSEEGKIFDADPETFKIQDGRLLVFYNGPQGNTLEQWNNEDPEGRLKLADKYWAEKHQ